MDIDKEMSKVDAQILALQKRIDQETQFLDEHSSIRRNLMNALAQAKAKKDSLEAKQLMEFCDTSGISKSDLWDAARKLKEQKGKESDLQVQSQLLYYRNTLRALALQQPRYKHQRVLYISRQSRL